MARKISEDQLDPRTNLQAYSKSVVTNADMWSDRLVRQEYSRLRDIARKRLQQLAIKEPESYAYQTNKDKYAPARGRSTKELRAQLPELAKFIAAKTGTVRGIREQRNKSVATLQSHGYTGITARNIRAFGEFMDEMRAQNLGKVYGSPQQAELFEFTQEHNIPWENIKDRFADWLREKKKLESYVRKENKRGNAVSSDDIIAEFDRLENKRQKKNERARNTRAKKKSGK